MFLDPETRAAHVNCLVDSDVITPLITSYVTRSLFYLLHCSYL
ncbi:hypothetical protein PCIT_a3766 [Pseudoalteromonas citrea]|uniref:Uncharacterized protein n=1 Tax=Pseudoalteromonas citrea TaxID=43655 RepID=A0AAD4AGF1_9GAMM|nr:hypothetical protein PCIT_a3762 [Pseudoalteromonas citrea]KAF7767693.1 hypothetical protein PCIT_a3766 [Pseudoalteromonas citrea]